VRGTDYGVGSRLTLLDHGGGEWPVEVVGYTSLPADLVVRWIGIRPLAALSANRDGCSTISLDQLKGVRVDLSILAPKPPH
jgi:hypothetical protein